MDQFGVRKALCILRPSVSLLTENPNVENARKIRDIITTIPDEIIQDLREYLLYIFVDHLRNKQHSTIIKEELIKTTTIIISKAKMINVKCFRNVYATVLAVIYDGTQPQFVIAGHEELKAVVLSCIITLMHSCVKEVTQSLYACEDDLILGHGLFLSMRIAEFEKLRSLRLTAINTVMAICQIDDNTDTSDFMLQNQVANIIASYFPGITRGLLNIAIGSEIQGHQLTVMALRAWARVISLVLKDKPSEEEETLHDLFRMHNIIKKEKPIVAPKFDDLSLRRTTDPQWIKNSAAKLNDHVKMLQKIKNFSHYKIRLELARCIGLILTTCSRNMAQSIDILLQCLMSLSEDDATEVSEEAMKALEAVKHYYMHNKNMNFLLELLEENFYKLLITLPRIIRTNSDEVQLSYLNEVAGYLKFLGEQRLPHILQSTSHVQKLLFVLAHVTEIENKIISILHIANADNFHGPVSLHGPHFWRQYKFIQDKTCEAKLRTICALIGKFGDIEILVDFITTFISDAPQYRKELILLLTWITNVPLKNDRFVSIYADAIEFLLTDELWYLPLQASQDVPLQTAHSNIIQCCLIMESLCVLIRNINCDNKKLLSKVVYKIMERVGSECNLISFVAARTLDEIAVTCGYKTVANVLQAISDYLSYSLFLRLRRVYYDPGVFDIIAAVMKYSSIDVLPCMTHLLQLIFHHLRNDVRKENAEAYVKIFHTFAICVRKIAKCFDISFVESEKQITKSKSLQVIEALLEYYEAKNIDKTIDNNDSDNDDNIAHKELDTQVKHQNLKHSEQVEDKINCSDQIVINNKVQYVEVDPETNECKTTEVYQEDIVRKYYTEVTEEKPVELPPYIQPIEDVAKHCLNLIATKNVKTSLIAIETLIECITILAKWEDRVLPLVHLIWCPLVEKFQKMDNIHEENVVVIHSAWKLLTVLARVSQDFLRSRMLKKIVSPVSKFLNDFAKKSYKQDSRMYEFTQVYKLQLTLLRTIGEMVVYLKLHEEQVWNILSMTEQYLDKYQDPTLQNCCIGLYQHIANYNADIVWVKCLSIWHSRVSKIPCDATFCINDLKVPENASDNYHGNVVIILDYLQTQL